MKITKKKLLFLSLGLAVVLLSLYRWQMISKAKSKAKIKDEYQVRRLDLIKRLSFPGRVIFGQEADLKFQTSGRLSWVGVKTGQKVKKGQAIASLDRRELYNRLQKSLNNYYKDRLDFEDTEDDWRDILDRDTHTQRLLEKNQKDLDNSVLDVELAHLSWRLAVITAPFDGIIDALRLPNSGINITPSQAKFHIVNPDSAFFEIEIEELDLNKLNLGQVVNIDLDFDNQASLSGRLDYISQTPSTGQNGGQVYLGKVVITDKPDWLVLRSGLNGQANLVLEKKPQVLAVPVDYLNYDKGKAYVFIINTNKVKTKRFIKTGIETEDYVEVLDGLSQNDIIAAGD